MSASILFASHTADAGIFRVGSHHLARELALLGHQVAHVSTPYTPVHGWLERGDPVRQTQALHGPSTDQAGVVHLVPQLPVPVSALEQRPVLQRELVRIGFEQPDFTIIDQPLLSGLLPRAGGCVVYRPTDLYPSGVKARRQRQVLGRANAVVATSARVLAALPATGRPSLLLENGVEYERFASVPERPREGFLYVGALDQRFNWNTVVSLSQLYPQEQVRLAGPVPTRVPRLPENVRLLGPVDYERLPELLHSARVGLMPFNTTPANAGRSPMKLYEYVAAGLPVLAPDMPTLTGREGAELFLFRYGGRTSLGEAAEAALEASPLATAAREIAKAQDWAPKALRLLSFLQAVRAETGSRR